MVVSDAKPEADPARPDPSVTPPPAKALVPGSSAPADEPPLTVLEARGGWALPDLSEIWRYRELLYFLALRDIKIRYKQTVLGLGWAVAQPLATMAVFALFLGRMAGVGASVPDYPLFVFAGMVAWTFFANTVTAAANSVIANERLITKVYFPRLAIPLSTVGVGLFDLVIASGLLAAMALAAGVTPGWSLLALPLVVLMLAVSSAGVGVMLAALVVAQRDFKYVLTFGVQLWMFATPSLYLPLESMGPRAREYLPLNPAHGLVLAFRQAALGAPIDWYSFAVSSAVGGVLAFAGLMYFRRVERSFADTI